MDAEPRILLTGGTGFFGRALLRHLLDSPEAPTRVCVLSRNPDQFLGQYPEFVNRPWLSFHRGDILRPDSLPAGGGFTHLLHAATDSTLGLQLSPLERYTQIVDGTRHMLDYAVTYGIKRFLLTSSGGVYGPQPLDMEQISESYNGMPDPLNAQHAYSVAKRCAEHLCAIYHDRHRIETVVARCFAFVGQDLPLDAHFAIGNFMRDALQKPLIEVAGDGTPVRTYMDQRDLSHWLMALLERGRPGQAYNVGSNAQITIRDLAHLVRDVLAPSKSVNIAGKITALSHRNRYVPSISKAQTELGLSLRYSLQDAILESVRSARRQGNTPIFMKTGCR